MDFKNDNNDGLTKAHSDLTTPGPDLYSDYLIKQPLQCNESEKVLRIQQIMSSRTYSADSKTNLKHTSVYAQSSNMFIDSYQEDTTSNNKPKIDFINGNYKLHNIPSSIKEKNQALGETKSEGAKPFCAGNSCSTEENNKTYTEKSTYCRAIFNNQELVYRTVAKNARLQKLVKKLRMIRQKQNEDDLWNNYINELKNRHGYTTETGSMSLHNLEEKSSKRIEDYSIQAEPCQNLLADLYGVPKKINRNVHFKAQNCSSQQRQDNYSPHIFENQSLCYPTSSQGRLMLLEKERKENELFNDWFQCRNYRDNIIFVDRECNKPRRNSSFRKSLSTKSTNTVDSQSQIIKISLTNKSIQTNFRCIFPFSKNKIGDSRLETAKERYKQVTKNAEKLKRKLEKSNTDIKENALDNIENKLNNLIKILNTFMVDIKTNNPFIRGNRTVLVSPRDIDNSLNELHSARSDTFGVIKREEAVCCVAHENSSATSAFVDAGPSTRSTKDKYMKIDTILNEEIDESNKFKRDIKDIMYQKTHCPRAVQITFDIPTRERSTEVTDSLSTTKVNTIDAVQEIGQSVTNDDRRMTIAVNTDPLGLLGLLRVSTEAVKQILSYMPHIDYYSYLSRLQFPQARNGVLNYICNICGASFERPSQLSDHIHTHNLGYSRDCCVCRHVLNMSRRRPGLFKCKYCGQRFTRAYCCELHQETCARRLGVRHEVHSNFNILQ